MSQGNPPPYRIPFNRPSFVGTEYSYVADAVADGHISGDGPATRRCEALLEDTLGVPKVLLTTSCTHALEMSAYLLDISPGDEVIVPSFTFVSTANAFVARGARVVFADIRRDTLNLDEELVEACVTSRTRAIVPVHYGGVGSEMTALLDIADRNGLSIVEDNAHGLFARYKTQLLGTLGTFGTQSFHETKNFTCGEGGALVINDEAMVDRAQMIREKGTNRNRFLKGQVDKYTWVDFGSSYVPSDVLAAILLAQLEARDAIQNVRRRLWERYRAGLSSWAARCSVRLPYVPDYCEHSAHVFYLLLPDAGSRDRFIRHLRARGILGVFHYVPLHSSEMGLRFGRTLDGCPVTINTFERLVRLPLFNSLTDAEQDEVIDAVLEFDPEGPPG